MQEGNVAIIDLGERAGAVRHPFVLTRYSIIWEEKMCSLKNEKNKMNSGAFQRVNAMVWKDDMMEQIDRTFCDNVFDFENANLSKKKLRRKL